MKKNIFLLCIVLLIIGVCIYFIINHNETFDKSAEEYFHKENQENKVTVSNVFSEPKTAEGGTFGQVTRILKEGTITNSGATMVITNRTNVKFYYMVWFAMERKVNNEWIEVKPKNANSIEPNSNYLMPNKSVEVKLDWSESYGILEKRRV